MENEEHKGNYEQHPGDLGGDGGDAVNAERASDQADNEEHECVVKHEVPPTSFTAGVVPTKIQLIRPLSSYIRASASFTSGIKSTVPCGTSVQPTLRPTPGGNSVIPGSRSNAAFSAAALRCASFPLHVMRTRNS